MNVLYKYILSLLLQCWNIFVDISCNCLQMPTVYKSISGLVTFYPFHRQWKIIGISRVQFPVTLAAHSIEASSFAAKNHQQDCWNLCYLPLQCSHCYFFSQRFFWAWFSSEAYLLSQNTPAFFHCSKFSSSPGRIWTMSFSHASIWWKISLP